MDINFSHIWPVWEIVAPISKGAYGQVYKAVRTQDSDVAAIKIISIPQNESETEKYRWEYSDDTIKGMYQKSAQEVLNEIDIMKKLRGSNNIVDILDYKLVEKETAIGYDIYIRMELLQPMAKHLSDLEIDSTQSAPFSMEDEAIKIGCDICRALETCHSVTTETKKQIIHRDIKPDNILYHANGDIYKLGDFGISKELSKAGTDHTRSIGTLKYLAPEVERGKYDCRADIYSLGLVLYYLTNKKRLPFVNGLGQDVDAVTRRLLGEQLPPPECASAGLARVIGKACAHRPEDRFSSAKEFRLALESIGQQSTTLESPIEEPNAVEPIRVAPVGTFGPKKKKGKAVAWLAVALLGFIAALWFGTKLVPFKAETDTQKPALSTNESTETSQASENQQAQTDTQKPSSSTNESTEVPQVPENQQAETTTPTDQENAALGKSRETAIQIALSNQYEVNTEDANNTNDRWEHWYKLETTANDSAYFVTFCGSDTTYAVYCKIYDAQLAEIETGWSCDESRELGVRLEPNATYWLMLDGSDNIATYQLSVKEEVCDAGISREKALPIQLDTEHIKSISVDGENDWYTITTGNTDAIYRFYVNAKINENPVHGKTTLALFNATGIKQKEITTNFGEHDYFDISLPTNTVYTVKVSAEHTVPAIGDYALCVSQKPCDAGVDQQSAMALCVDDVYTAKLDASLADWYVCTFSEDGRYTIDFHNIDIGCRVTVEGTRENRSLFSTTVKNEDSASRVINVKAGDQIYFTVEPWSVADAENANGTYIIGIAKEES